jgi:hypothetical protein
LPSLTGRAVARCWPRKYGRTHPGQPHEDPLVLPKTKLRATNRICAAPACRYLNSTAAPRRRYSGCFVGVPGSTKSRVTVNLQESFVAAAMERKLHPVGRNEQHDATQRAKWPVVRRASAVATVFEAERRRSLIDQALAAYDYQVEAYRENALTGFQQVETTWRL